MSVVIVISSRRRHTRSLRDWSSDVCSSDLGPWSLQSLSVATHDNQPARVTIKLAHTDGRVVAEEQVADGPVDALVKAIDHATGIHAHVRTRSEERRVGKECRCRW